MLLRVVKAVLLASILATLAASTRTVRADVTWTSQSGDWSVATNWSPNIPTINDQAYVVNGGTVSVTQNEINNELLVGASVGTSSVVMTAGKLSTNFNEIIGYTGPGSFTQSGGTNTTIQSPLLGQLDVGFFGNGAYELKGTGLITMGVETVTNSSTFTQSAGTNLIANGIQFYNSATYLLSDGLLSTPSESLGTHGGGPTPGTAVFAQTGGIHIATFYGIGGGGNGSLLLSGTGSVSAQTEIVGWGYLGSVNQSGGTHSVSKELDFGYFSSGPSNSGSYTLSGSGRLSAVVEIVGHSASGSFTQSGGTNALSSGLIIAQSSTASGTYNLNGGLLTLPSGGLTQGAGNGAFNFGGGTLGATAPWSSSMNMNLAGTASAATVDTTGGNIILSGNLTGSGSLNAIGAGILSLRGTNSNLAAVTVDGGTLQTPSGFLTAANEYVGISGNGTVVQTGGTNTITNALSLAVNPGSVGTYNLYGGLLNAANILVGSGSAALNITGGTLTNGATGATVAIPIVLTSSGSSGTFNTALAALTLSGLVSGPGNLVKTGTSSLILSAPNTYTGDTTISGGAILLANALAVQNSTLVLNGFNSLQFDPNLSSGRGTVSIGGLSGGGSLTLSDSNNNPINVLIGGNGKDTTYSGTIGGNGGLVMAGTGSVDLSGTSNWTGGLFFDPGTIAFHSDAALGAASNPIIFNGTGTLQPRGNIALSANRGIAIGPTATATFDTFGYTLTARRYDQRPGRTTQDRQRHVGPLRQRQVRGRHLNCRRHA